MCWDVVGEDDGSEKDDVMRDERVDEQIQRLLDARDQRAFSRLLIDSVCSMPSDDFHRVREKLIEKFISDQRRSAATSSDDIRPGVKVETDADEQLDGRRRAEENALTAGDEANSSALSLRIVNVRSCKVEDEETDHSWSHGVVPPSDGDRLIVKQELPDSSSKRVGRCDDIIAVDECDSEAVLTTNYITIAPIESTTDAENGNESVTVQCRNDDQTQTPYSQITDNQPASTVRHSQPGQV